MKEDVPELPNSDSEKEEAEEVVEEPKKVEETK